MSADNKKQQPRSMLAGKSTDELEKLLAREAVSPDAAGPNADHITTLLEVIAERESAEEHDAQMTEQAWKDFQEYYQLRKQQPLEPDTDEEHPHDHPRKTEYGQRSPRLSRAVRCGVAAAIVAVLLCGTALGWNLFRAVADWTAETFSFLTGQERQVRSEEDVFLAQRLLVKSRTDTPAIPKWAPEGAVANGVPAENGRTDRFVARAAYTVGTREFSIRIIIHDTPPEIYTITYQKNSVIEEEHLANGITHYIMGNTETLSAMWLNGCVEGHIQGELTLEELRQMIDSIYEE